MATAADEVKYPTSLKPNQVEGWGKVAKDNANESLMRLRSCKLLEAEKTFISLTLNNIKLIVALNLKYLDNQGFKLRNENRIDDQLQ
ncbi:MAG: hypothetical protein F6K19_46015 [Cyanothece sp. SIO1E1]|nr:hypothetical protein [Cyanothece sp. SIO1E1]